MEVMIDADFGRAMKPDFVPNLFLSDRASLQISRLHKEEHNPHLMLRVSVYGGGCSGMSYKFELTDKANDDDYTFENRGSKMVVDPKSCHLINDSMVDFEHSFAGSQFTITNPTAKQTCGCGTSFSV